MKNQIYEISEISAIILPIAEKYKLKAVYLFGSYARGNANENSNIDFIVDTSDSLISTLFDLGGLYADLSEAFCKEIDLVTLSSLTQPTRRESDIQFRDNLNRERMSVYAAA